MKKYKIFISSPSDVSDERALSRSVINKLNKKYKGRVFLEPVLYEERWQSATRGDFQSQIEEPSSSDITILILWSRLGTLLPKSYKGDCSEKCPVTGTEYEFENAWKSYGDNKSPDVFVYKKTAPIQTYIDDPKSEELKKNKDIVEQFVAYWFKHGDNSFKSAFHTFNDEKDFTNLLETHIDDWIRDKIKTDRGSDVIWLDNPYMGLNSFDLEHEIIFYGRDRQIFEIRRRYKKLIQTNHPFLLVLGASGSGKSSLLKAGLLPHLLTKGFVENITDIRYAIFRPSENQDSMFGALASAFFKESAIKDELEKLGYTPQKLEEFFEKVDNLSITPLEQALKKERKVVVIIDQLEEIFSNKNFIDEDIELFMKFIKVLVKSGLVWVLASMRSDFTDVKDSINSLSELSSDEGTYLLSFPSITQIEELVKKPAYLSGLRFEEKNGVGLDKAIIEDTSKNNSTLPLLEHILSELYINREQDNLLTFEAYKKLGGLYGAIGKKAETLYTSFSDDEKKALEKLILELVTISQESKRVSRVILIDSIKGMSTKLLVIEKMSEQRLLVKDTNSQGKATVRVAHEAIFESWQRAKKLIIEAEPDIALRETLKNRYLLFKDKKEEKLKGAALSSAVEMLKKRGDDFVSKEIAKFIKSSKKSSFYKRSAIIVGSISIVVASVVTSIYTTTLENKAQYAREQAEKNAQIAIKNEKEAEKFRHDSEKMANTVLFDAIKAIRPLARPDISKSLLDKVRSYYENININNIKDLKKIDNAGYFYLKSGNTYKELGYFSKAIESYQEAVEIEKILIKFEANESKKFGWQNHLSTIYFNLGNLYYAINDRNNTEKYYQKALEIREKLVKLYPKDMNLKSSLAASYDGMGNFYYSMDVNLSHAEDYYLKAQKIREKLDSHNNFWQSNLSIHYRLLGNLYYKKNDKNNTKKYYQKALEISEKWAEQNPSNIPWQNELSYCYYNMGKFYSKSKDFNNSKMYYLKALKIREKLVKHRFKNREWQKNLWNNYYALYTVTKEKQYLKKCIDQMYSVKKRGWLSARDKKLLQRYEKELQAKDVQWNQKNT